MGEVMPHFGQQWSSSITQLLILGFSICVGATAGAITGLIAKLTGRVTLGGSYSDHGASWSRF